MFQKYNSVVAVFSMASRGTSDTSSNVICMLSGPCLKVGMQHVSEREVLNRGALSLSAPQPLGKHNLKAISRVLRILFNLDLFGGLEIWREQPN